MRIERRRTTRSIVQMLTQVAAFLVVVVFLLGFLHFAETFRVRGTALTTVTTRSVFRTFNARQIIKVT